MRAPLATGLALLLSALAPSAAGAQTQADEKISIHRSEVRVHESNVEKSIEVKTDPAEDEVDVRVGARLKAGLIQAVLTNVNIDGTFRGNLTRILDRLRGAGPSRPEPPPTRPSTVSPLTP